MESKHKAVYVLCLTVHFLFAGVTNLTALGNLMQWQTVAYDFKFHPLNFETDVRVLTMSEGKSLLTVSRYLKGALYCFPTFIGLCFRFYDRVTS